MSSIQYVTGDATAPLGTGNRFICHVCNDVGGWGRGFVVAISKRWPEPEAKYRAWHKAGPRELFTLGALQIVPVAPEIWVANMVAQHGLKTVEGVPPIRYDALRTCLTHLAEEAEHLRASVHMPRIGCGLAGGTWAEIQPIIENTLCAAGIAVTVYDLEEK